MPGNTVKWVPGVKAPRTSNCSGIPSQNCRGNYSRKNTVNQMDCRC